MASPAESSQWQQQKPHLSESAQAQTQARYKFNTYAPPVPGVKTKTALAGSAAALAANLEPLLSADAHAGPQAWKDAFAGGPAFGDEEAGRTEQEAKEAEQSFDAAILASSEPAKLQVVLDLARDLVARPSARSASAQTVEPGVKEEIVEAWTLLSLALFGHRGAFETQAAAAATPLLGAADQKAGLICVVYLSRAAYASSVSVLPRLRAASATSLGPPSLAALQELIVDAGKAQDAKRVLRFVDGIVALHSGTTNAWLLYARARALSTRSACRYDWGSLHDYWQRYASHRCSDGHALKPPRYLFDFLLRHYVAQGDTGKATHVLHAMVDNGHTTSAQSWLALLRIHPARRPAVRAISSANWAIWSERHHEAEAARRSTMTQKRTLDKLVRLRAHQRDVRGALLVLRAFGAPTGGQVRRRGSIAPSASTYAPLAHLFASLDSPHSALRFCSLAFEHRRSEDPAEHLEMALLSALTALRRAERAPEALALASDVLGIRNIPMAAAHAPIKLNAKLKLTDRLYATLFRVVAHLPPPKTPDVVRFLLRDLFARGMKPGKQVLRAIGHMLFVTMPNTMDWDRAKRTLYKVSPTALHKRTQRLETAIEMAEKEKLSSLVLPAERLHRLDTFVRMLDEHGFEDKLVLAGPRNLLLERSLVERMQPYLEAQPAPSQLEEEEQSASSSVQNSEKGTAVEREVDLSIALSSAGYAMRLRVYAVQRLDHASASALFRAMIRHGITPDMQHIAPLVEGLVKAGQVRDAAHVTTRAVASLGVEPTLRIHTALIRGYTNQGDWESVEMQLNKVQSTGLAIDAALQEVLATARSRAREVIGAPASKTEITLLHQPQQPLSTQGITARLSVLLKAGAILPAQQLLVSHLRPEKPDVDAVLRRDISQMSIRVDERLQRLRKKKSHDEEALARVERTQWRIEEVVRLNRARLIVEAGQRVGARREIVKLIFDAVVDEDLKE